MIASSQQPTKRSRGAARGEKRVFIFVPQPDITAFDLAEATELLNLGILVVLRAVPPATCDSVYDAMGEGAKRQFDVRDLSVIAAPAGSKLHLPPGAKQ